MTVRSALARLAEQEQLNFILTNRIPRRLLTRFVGWFGRIEQPLVRDLSMGVWRLFSDLDLSDSKETEFRSLHHCFTRELKDGARPVEPDPSVMVSPCDAIVGACGRVADGELLQVKGSPYAIEEFLVDPALAAAYRNGRYVTLRLTSSMYHRFHAPHDCRVEAVTYISGDVWNVNPITLRRVAKVFCRNERAVIRLKLATEAIPILLVPVAAILVASIRLNFLDVRLPADAGRLLASDASFRKGEEMGWFEHGSTIVVLAPEGFSLCDNVHEGARIRMGQPLLRLPLGHCSVMPAKAGIQ